MSPLRPVSPLTRPRKATPNEAAALADTLAAAFFDDPVIGWAFPHPDRRRQILPGFFGLLVADSLAHDEAYTTDDIAGVALWLPPSALEPSEEETAAAHAQIERLTEEFSPAVLTLFDILDRVHPRQPHYYLPVVGTHPDRQGQGIGSALLGAVLERCDRGRMPAYLEATSDRNTVLYQRHGFEVTARIPLPDGPTAAAMWREPR